MLNRANIGLVVVDVQGKLARLVDESDILISNCGKLIKGAQVLGYSPGGVLNALAASPKSKSRQLALIVYGVDYQGI